ncbi:MAG: LysR substrate-binding domain-containing protein [Bacteroidota bacterium]
MRFDLTDLRLFLNVAETGSITAGAERSFLALASASARIRGMEEALGTELLVRGRRGVQPTPAGRTLQHHARVVLQQMERLRGELGQYAHGLKGHIRLMCNTAALSEYLPEALGAFLAVHPHVDVDIEERLSHDIVRAVAEGLTDVGIASDSVDYGQLETLPFRLDRLVLVTAPVHPLAQRAEIPFAQTLDQPYIGLDVGSALQDFLAGHAATAGRRIAYRVRVRGFDAICRMVEQNVGVAVIPDVAAQRGQRSMQLARIPLNDPWATRRLNICVRTLAALPAHAQGLVAALTPGDTA